MICKVVLLAAFLFYHVFWWGHGHGTKSEPRYLELRDQQMHNGIHWPTLIDKAGLIGSWMDWWVSHCFFGVP